MEWCRKGLSTGLYEKFNPSYSSPVFCVWNQEGKSRVVDYVQEIKKVTIKGARLPHSPDLFS